MAKRNKIHTFKIRGKLQEELDRFSCSLPAGESVKSVDVGDGVVVVVTEYEDNSPQKPKNLLIDQLIKAGNGKITSTR